MSFSASLTLLTIIFFRSAHQNYLMSGYYKPNAGELKYSWPVSMDGVYIALGESDTQQPPQQLCMCDDRFWQGEFCVDKWIWKITSRCAHQNPLRDWSPGRTPLVGFPHSGLRHLVFSLNEYGNG